MHDPYVLDINILCMYWYVLSQHPIFYLHYPSVLVCKVKYETSLSLFYKES